VAEVISIKDLSFTFANSESPVLRRINLDFEPGEFALICGPTGSGKSTLLRALTGLVPFYSSGQLSGEVWLEGNQLAGKQPHEFSHLVGYVNQQPEGAFVSETVIEELAFGMEQLGLPVETMKQNIANYAELLGITELLHSNLEFLSGGQQQRVAIAAALACGQKILLLDEPTSALDVTAADDLLALLKRLCSEHGITVLLAEHRIERAIGMVDSVTVVHGDGSANKAMVASGLDPVLRDYRMVPPVIELGQRLGWNPLPLSVQSAKITWTKEPGLVEIEQSMEVPAVNAASGEPSIDASGVSVSYGSQVALNSANLRLYPGTIHALMGPNGSGKTSLLWALQGSLKHTGLVRVSTAEEGAQATPESFSAQERIRHIAMVPQTAADLLVLTSVSAELEESDRFAGAASGSTAKSFASLAGRIDPSRHPHDLSAGQQLALVLAIQLAKGASNILLDEPTRGLDYQAKRNLASQLQSLAAAGKAVLFASHDVEFVALVADTVTLIEDGRLTLEGPASRVLATLGAHAPQVMQVTGKAWRTEQVVKP
jgi:energy-coupling factor transport system ATP-binding protein